MFKKVKDKPYYTNNHSCFLLTVHMVLVTKYRKPVLQGKVRDYVYTLTKETMESAPADRTDIKDQCAKRLAVYQEFVPADLTEDAIKEIIQGVLNDLGIEKATPKDKGKIMKELMPKVKGKAEGSVVNKLVGEFMA